jgi:serine/threonine protein kinase
MASIGNTRWQTLSPLLDKLLDAGAAQREERLARLRHDDPALADEIAALLAAEVAIQREAFLEGSALDFAAMAGGALAEKRIGAYTLERPLGHGGMGSVWLARRSDGRFEGKAAVKFLHFALLTRGGPERFEREGNVLARLAHPNIARLLDAGVAEGGQPYLVLEYVEGEPIDRWCEDRSLDIEVRIRLFLDVLRAVGHAHGKLILHRDLKPSNILVTAEGQVKLLDFGIAKLLDDDTRGAQATELTQLAGRAFTPEYAAPEQIRGEEVTMATDVYALGVLLYRLLSGQHPTSSVTRTGVEQMRAVLETEPAPLSKAASQTGLGTSGGPAHTSLPARALRGDLDNIAAKALKKLPRERYATVAAFADDLERYLKDEPVTARPDSRSYRIRKFVLRHRLGVAAASATLLALVAGVIGTTWQAIEARRERDNALYEAERALAKGSLVELMLGALRTAGRPLTQRELLDRSVQLVEKQFARDPRIAIDLMLPFAGQYLNLGDTEAELAVMRRLGEIAASTGDPYLVAKVACYTVETELSRGRKDLAEAQLATGLEALAKLARPDFKLAGACLQAEADVAWAHGDLVRALERITLALQHTEREGDTRGNIYPKQTAFLAALQRERGDLKASFELLKRLQRLDEEAGRTESIGYLAARRDEAALLMLWGEYRAARAILDGIAPRWRELTGDDATPSWLDSARGRLALRFEELELAQRALAEAAGRSRAQGAVARVLPIEFWLAWVHVRQQQFAEAERLLASHDASPPDSGRYSVITPATVRAELLRVKGAIPEAIAAIDAEVVRLRLSPARDAIPLATALREAARIHLAAGDGLKAHAIASEAAAVSERVARDPASSADVGEALLLLAQAHRALGQLPESRAIAQRAARSLAAGLSDDHRLTREALTLTSP